MFRVMFLPIFLRILTYSYRTTEAITVGCGDTETLEGSSYTSTCYPGDMNNKDTWTLVPLTGRVTDIGSCTANTCVSASPRYDLRSQSDSQRVTINNITDEEKGILMCSEHHPDGRVETANCTLIVRSVMMSSCEPQGFLVPENDQKIFTCHVSKATRPITWLLRTPSGQTKTLGSCQGLNSCSSPDSPYINATWQVRTFSDLRIDNIKRETAGMLMCSDGIDTDNCTLDVFIKVKVEACSEVQVHRENWTVETSCNVTRGYSALGRYEYGVDQQWEPPGVSFKYERAAFKDLQRFKLSPYNNTATGERLYHGIYTASWPLPSLDGTYSEIKTQTLPGGVYTNVDGFFVVERPSPPIVECEGTLRDAGRVPCVCSTSSLGSPAGRLIWFSGDTVLAAGQYGVTSLQFPSNVTVDGCEVMQITCQLDWTFKQNVSFPVACSSKETADNDPVIAVSVPLGVAVVVFVVLVIVLPIRGHCWCRHQQQQPELPVTRELQTQQQPEQQPEQQPPLAEELQEQQQPEEPEEESC